MFRVDGPPSGLNSPSADRSGHEPPAYTPEPTTGAKGTSQLTSHTDVSSVPQQPSARNCLAHLKLLFAIQSMKEEIGYMDGLWNIWDATANRDAPRDNNPALEAVTPADEEKIILSQIREKRWAVFVARAVDRYEAWWNTLDKCMLREVDMTGEGTGDYVAFTTQPEQMPWTPTVLPPLDVVMVLHAHMLNPRSFLEDTMRNGMGAFWSTGMPWNAINTVIDDIDFNYNVTENTKSFWTAQTGRSWNNADDPIAKLLVCPACGTTVEVPWTTCGRGDVEQINNHLGLVGTGYGDGNFSVDCPSCSVQIDKELLSVAKFVRDVKNLLVHSIPMPGTLLEPATGMPEVVPAGIRGQMHGRTFPNRMIQRALRSLIIDLIKPGVVPRPTMETVRDLIEKAIGDSATVKTIDGLHTGGMRLGYALGPDSRVAVRKMMSRYWQNFSPFALDLGGAVMRQGVFIDKMHCIDWLHSPTATDTMERLIKKYNHFIELIAANPTKLAVPTLDVDLAWHTHQLHPSAYYRFTIQKTSKFIDHDDKIDQDKLNQAFEWTSKAYQERFGQVYSECTCWYCEAIRASHISFVGKILRTSNNEEIAEAFHKSGASSLCPPGKSPHISAHNAVKSEETVARSKVTEKMRLRQRQRLDANYQKAVKRAEKRGRKLPPQDEYYNHWGCAYFMYSPFVYPLYFTPGIYAGWDPCHVPAGVGAWANCAAGSCGAGGVAVGACGGPGGCGNPGGCGGGAGAACSGGGCGGGGGNGCGSGGGGACGGGGP